eukprot:363662-Chlamydomonas_euryale.AAC.25
MDGTVATEDEPPVALGQMPAGFMQQHAKLLRPGRLLRFAVGDGGLIFHEGKPAGADLKYLGPGNQRRGRADQFSKVRRKICPQQNLPAPRFICAWSVCLELGTVGLGTGGWRAGGWALQSTLGTGHELGAP